jgi:hypothetical protein
LTLGPRERSSDHPGEQRQLTRQVNGSHRQAEQVEARLSTEVADGQHAGTRLKTLGELVDLWIERLLALDGGHGRAASRPSGRLRAACRAVRRPVGARGVRVRSDAGRCASGWTKAASP